MIAFQIASDLYEHSDDDNIHECAMALVHGGMRLLAVNGSLSRKSSGRGIVTQWQNRNRTESEHMLCRTNRYISGEFWTWSLGVTTGISSLHYAAKIAETCKLDTAQKLSSLATRAAMLTSEVGRAYVDFGDWKTGMSNVDGDVLTEGALLSLGRNGLLPREYIVMRIAEYVDARLRRQDCSEFELVEQARQYGLKADALAIEAGLVTRFLIFLDIVNLAGMFYGVAACLFDMAINRLAIRGEPIPDQWASELQVSDESWTASGGPIRTAAYSLCELPWRIRWNGGASDRSIGLMEIEEQQRRTFGPFFGSPIDASTALDQSWRDAVMSAVELCPYFAKPFFEGWSGLIYESNTIAATPISVRRAWDHVATRYSDSWSMGVVLCLDDHLNSDGQRQFLVEEWAKEIWDLSKKILRAGGV